MDRILDFSNEYLKSANEGAVDALYAAGTFAVMIGGLKILMNVLRKKNDKAKANSQKAYFDLHQIPLEQRNDYAKKIVADIKRNFEDAIKQIIANKHKSGLDKVEAKIIDRIRSYVVDGNRPVTFKNSDVKITYNTSPDHYEYNFLIDASYHGNGFIPEDNVYEIAQSEFYPIVDKVVDAIRAQYREEIQCKFVEIDIIPDSCNVTIMEP